MQEILKQLGIEDINAGGFCGEWIGSGDTLDSISPDRWQTDRGSEAGHCRMNTKK